VFENSSHDNKGLPAEATGTSVSCSNAQVSVKRKREIFISISFQC